MGERNTGKEAPLVLLLTLFTTARGGQMVASN